MAIWVWAGWVVRASAAACPDPATEAALVEHLAAAEAAFSDLDIEAFIAKSDAMRAAIPCLAEIPTPAVVARVHRLEGLRAFGERDVSAVRAFAAARALAPDHVFAPEIVPPNSPILEDYLAMDLAAGDLEAMPEPLQGALYVDGRPTRDRPTAWPALIQLVDGEKPAWSTYLDHDKPLPAYDLAPTPAPVPAPVPAPAPVPEAPLGPSPVAGPVPAGPAARDPWRRRAPLFIAAGTAATATGVMYGLAARARSVYFDPDTPDRDLAGLKAQTNGLAVASGVAGLAALGCGAGIAITW